MISNDANVVLESIPKHALEVLDFGALTRLYDAVGWTSYTRDPNLLGKHS